MGLIDAVSVMALKEILIPACVYFVYSDLWIELNIESGNFKEIYVSTAKINVQKSAEDGKTNRCLIYLALKRWKQRQRHWIDEFLAERFFWLTIEIFLFILLLNNLQFDFPLRFNLCIDWSWVSRRSNTCEN